MYVADAPALQHSVVAYVKSEMKSFGTSTGVAGGQVTVSMHVPPREAHVSWIAELQQIVPALHVPETETFGEIQDPTSHICCGFSMQVS